MSTNTMMRLEEKYQKEVIPAMLKKFGYENVWRVPYLDKVIINAGFGKLSSGKTSEEQKKVQEAVVNDLGLISGQKAILARARKSISAFKSKKGTPIGAKVTLRQKRMYGFLERLIYLVLPRTRDFKGILSANFDAKGNLNLGLREQIAFPEILPEKTKFIFGLEIAVVVKRQKKKEEAVELLRLLGFPIKIT